MKKIYLLFIVFLLASCMTEIPTSPSAEWGKYTIRLESRPPVIEKGMVELLTLVDYEEKGRGWDLIVYYRMGPTGRWIQAMQDGHTGVYRRAMMVTDPVNDVLHVHIKNKQSREEMAAKVARKEILLEFPLDYSTVTLINSKD